MTTMLPKVPDELEEEPTVRFGPTGQVLFAVCKTAAVTGSLAFSRQYDK